MQAGGPEPEPGTPTLLTHTFRYSHLYEVTQTYHCLAHFVAKYTNIIIHQDLLISQCYTSTQIVFVNGILAKTQCPLIYKARSNKVQKRYKTVQYAVDSTTLCLFVN